MIQEQDERQFQAEKKINGLDEKVQGNTEAIVAATKAAENTKKKGKGFARRGTGGDTPLEVDTKEGKKHKGLKKSGA